MLIPARQNHLCRLYSLDQSGRNKLGEGECGRSCSTYLFVEINHERALLGGWVQHSGAPAGRS